MRIQLNWNEKLSFTASDGQHAVGMDSKPPLGSDKDLTPKQLVVSGLCGCTAMDVVSLLKKHKQNFQKFEMVALVSTTQGAHPIVFSKIDLEYRFHGDPGAVDPKILAESVHLSQSKYCGVSAMLSKACPIAYRIFLNDEEVGQGQAQFY